MYVQSKQKYKYVSPKNSIVRDYTERIRNLNGSFYITVQTDVLTYSDEENTY